MKSIAILPVVFLCLSAGVVKSQAPLSGSTVSNLQTLIDANKTLIDKQKKTLDGLDALAQAASQLKSFSNR